jgi:hypothetical protein
VSLINDALKNARKHQRDSSAEMPPLPPVRPVATRRHSHWPLGLIIILFLLIAGVLIVFAVRPRPALGGARIVSTQNPPPSAEAVPAPSPVPVANTVTAAPPAPVVASAPAPAPPAAPKLQGIFYDPVHPTAIVSGKTVHLGDVIGGFRVKSISTTTLVLVGPDKKETPLTMAQ